MINRWPCLLIFAVILCGVFAATGILFPPVALASDPCAYNYSGKVSLLSTSFDKRTIGAGYSEFVFNGPVGDYTLTDAHMNVANGFECGGPEILLPSGSSRRISVALPSGTHQVADVSSSIGAANAITTERGPSWTVGPGAGVNVIDFHCIDTNPFKSILKELYPGFCAQVDAFYAANPRTVEHGVGGQLTLPWFTDVAVEDEAINVIAASGSITLQTDSGPSFSFPATNCVRIAGPDPKAYADSHNGKYPLAIVFMRDRVASTSQIAPSLSDFVRLANNAVTNGFHSVSPFREYMNDISFYVDLKRYNSNNILGYTPPSSCVGVSNRLLRLVYFPGGLGGGFSSGPEEMVSHVNIGSLEGYDYRIATPRIELHEVGHSLAALNDEYIDNLDYPTGSIADFDLPLSNCSTYPPDSYRGADNHWYGARDSEATRGCYYTYRAVVTSPRGEPRYYNRPSQDSIMRGRDGVSKKFNVISCGYIVAAINGEEPVKANAQKYWPNCMKMDTVKDGIPDLNPNTPTITAPSTSRSGMWSTLFANIQHLLMAQVSGAFDAKVNVVTRVGGRVITSTENGSCVSTLIAPSGMGNTSGCVRVLVSQPAGTYRLEWSGGYPSGADTAKPPTINPPYPQTLGERPAGTSPITFYIDFTAAPLKSEPRPTDRVSYAGAPGFPVTVSGTNFTPTGNSVQLVNKSTGQTFDISDIPASLTTSLQFTVPTSTPEGTYDLKIGAFNSDWSSGVRFNVTKSSLPIVTLASDKSSVQEGNPIVVTWTSSGADSCTKSGSVDAAALAVWSANTEVAGSITLSPRTSGSLSVTCTGVGGQTSQSISIAVAGYAAPEISITATPSNVVVGQPVTVTWNATKATSCVGTGYGDSQVDTLWKKSQPLSGSLTYKPFQNSSLSLQCTGAGGTVAEKGIYIETTVPPLVVSCSNTPYFANMNQLATFSSSVSGGYGPGSYTYLWSGTDGLVGSASSVSKIYTTIGTKNASLKVSSLGVVSATSSCAIGVGSAVTNTGLFKPVLTSVTPATTGVPGTTYTVTGFPFAAGQSTVILERGGQSIYLRPTSVTQGSTRSHTLNFVFDSSIPLPNPEPGAVYNVKVVNTTYPATAPSAALSFTLNSVLPPPPEMPQLNVQEAISFSEAQPQTITTTASDSSNIPVPSTYVAPVSQVMAVPVKVIPKTEERKQGTVSGILRTAPYDFGGMYAKTGLKSYANPATGGQSCPQGYSATKLTDSKEYALSICLRKAAVKQDPLYDFGGIYGSLSGNRYPNYLATNGYCPSGYLSAQIGDAPADQSKKPLNFCYRAHVSSGVRYEIGAVVAGAADKCPVAYKRSSFGSGKYAFSICYRETTSASAGLSGVSESASLWDAINALMTTQISF